MKLFRKGKYVLLASLLAAPSLAYAAPTSIRDLSGSILGIISALVPIVVGVALVFFLWGVKNYIASAGDEEKVKEGRAMIMYGIVGLAVMLSVWGLVRIVVTTLFGTLPQSASSTSENGLPGEIYISNGGGVNIDGESQIQRIDSGIFPTGSTVK